MFKKQRQLLPETMSLGTNDWILATKGLKITAYVDKQASFKEGQSLHVENFKLKHYQTLISRWVFPVSQHS